MSPPARLPRLSSSCARLPTRLYSDRNFTSDFAIMQRVGNTLPAGMLHCTALGKIALAFGPEHLAQEVVARPLKKMTPNTITKVGALKQELDRVRKQGWAIVPD